MQAPSPTEKNAIRTFLVILFLLAGVLGFRLQSPSGAITLNSFELTTGESAQVGFVASDSEARIVVDDETLARLNGTLLTAQTPGLTQIRLEAPGGQLLDTAWVHILPAPTLPFEITITLDGVPLIYDAPVLVSELPVSYREGFLFEGIDLNGELLEPSLLLEESLSLESRFTPIPETITLTLTDETGTVLSEQTPLKGSVLEDVVDAPLVYLSLALCEAAPLEKDFRLDEDITLIVPSEPVDCEPEEETEEVVPPVIEPDEPTTHTVRITDETGTLLKTLSVKENQQINLLDFPSQPSGFEGYYLPGDTCDHPFDVSQVITGDVTLIQGVLNDTTPCIELTEMAFSGDFNVSETIHVHHRPTPASVTYEWFMSTNNRDFTLMPQHTGPAMDLTPDHHRMYLAVNVIGVGDYLGTLKMGTPRIGLSSQSIDSPEPETPPVDPPAPEQPDPIIEQAIIDGFIPISNKAEFANITTTSSVTFAAGTFYELVTEGGLDKNYILVNNITLSGTVTDSFINGTFTGTLDGNGFELSNLEVNGVNAYNGLFEKLDGAMIRNIFISNFDVSGNQQVGVLAGGIVDASFTQIINVHITNSVVYANTQNVGGFIGQTKDSSVLISQSSFNGTVSGGSNSGGIVGRVAHENSSTTNKVANQLVLDNTNIYGRIEGVSNVGGIFGKVERGQLSKFKNILELQNVSNYALISGSSFNVGGLAGFISSTELIVSQFENHGIIKGKSSNVGGFIGTVGGNTFTTTNPSQSSITISNSLNTASVELGTSNIGGIIGSIDFSNGPVHTELEFVYNAGLVTGSGSNIGGIIGYTSEPITFSGVVYLESTANLSIGAINSSPVINGSPLALSNLSMQAISTFEDLGWDIGLYPNQHADKVWAMGHTNGIKTFPWLSKAESPEDLQIALLNAQINQSVIPLAHPEDLVNISTTSSVTFAAGTIYETVVSGGLDKDYMLVDDIDLSSLTNNDTVILGSFNGSLEGNGFSLSNLTINNNAQDGIGLFEFIGHATIQNLTLDNFAITGRDYVGSLASGVSGNAIINNVTVTSSSVQGEWIVGGLLGDLVGSLRVDALNASVSITGEQQVGGLIGTIDSSSATFTGITMKGSIIGSSSFIGGVVGSLIESTLTVTDFSNQASISSMGNTGDSFDVAGIIGLATESALTIKNSANVGTILGENNVGGLIGRNYASTLTMSAVYNTAQIVRTSDQIGNNAGGLIGLIEASNGRTQHLSDVFSISDVVADNNAGGLIGQVNDGALTLIHSYAAPTHFSYSNITGALIGRIQQSSLTFSGVFYPNTYTVSVGSIATTTVSGNPDALPVASMLAVETFEGAGWNITGSSLNATTWAIGYEGDTTYPYLVIQGEPIAAQKVTLTETLITSKDDLANMSLTGDYVLTGDISLAGSHWTPIANFSGTFDGNGFTISDGTIDESGDDVGFFSTISGASIKNLTFDNFNVTGAAHTGILVGQIKGGINTISSIMVTNSSLNGTSRVGGIIGYNAGERLTVNNLINQADIDGSASGVGGIIGRSDNLLVMTKTLNYGKVQGASSLNAGLIAYISDLNSNVTISESGNFGQIGSESNGIGGFVGEIRGASLSISNSINLGSIHTVLNNAGGFIGYVNPSKPSVITFSALYSSGDITNDGDRAGLIFGRFDNAVSELVTETALFSLDSLSTTVDGYTSGTAENDPYNSASTKTSYNAMHTFSNFDDAGWDISQDLNGSSIWVIDDTETLPWLRWMGSPDASMLVDDVSTQISNGFIPIASKDDFDNIDAHTDTVFASGTKYEGTYTPGVDKNYILITDVALVGSYSTAVINDTFTGTLDGNGYTLSDLTINQSSKDRLALFRELNNATIKNLGVDNFDISGATRIGVLAGRGGGSVIIENITLSTIAINASSDYSGGLVGEFVSANVTLSNIHMNNIDVDSNSIIVGGLAGDVQTSNLKINEVVLTNASIQSDSHLAGGLFGRIFDSTATIHNTTIQGSVEVATGGNGYHIGGVIGAADQSTITMGSLNTDVTVYGESDDIGGLIGEIKDSSLYVDSLFSTGSITGGYNTGGLIGFTTGTSIEMINVSRSGSVIGIATSNGRVGGFIGHAVNANVTLSQITVSSDVRGNHQYVSGLMGRADGGTLSIHQVQMTDMKVVSSSSWAGGLIARIVNNTLTLDDIAFVGSVTGTSSVAGLVGQLENSTATITNIDLNASVGLSAANAYAGGFIAYILDSTVMVSQIDMSVTVLGQKSYVGGMSGAINDSDLIMTDIAMVDMAISASLNQYVGGLVGYLQVSSNLTMSQISITNIDITAPNVNQVGGIAGAINNARISMENVLITGSNISGEDYVAGIIGQAANQSRANLINVTHAGIVTASDSDVGGIIGYSSSTLSLTSVQHDGNVVGNDRVGGIIGQNTAGGVLNGSNIFAFNTAISKNSTAGKGTIVGSISSNINITAVWDGTSNFSNYVGAGQQAEADSPEYAKIVSP